MSNFWNRFIFRTDLQMARKQAPIADLKFYTEVVTSDRSVYWTIEKFPLLVKTTPNGEALLSPKFEIEVTGGEGKQATTEWLLMCFPTGHTEKHAGHLTLYICLSSLGNLSAKSIGAHCELGLQGAELRKFNHTFEIDSSTYDGYGKFVSHKELAADSGRYVSDGKLIITCKITLHSVVSPRTFVGGPLANDSIQMRLAAVSASAASRHAWEALKQENFVDLGPSTVTLVFGEGAEEELCHTFPLAARSAVLQRMLTTDMLEKSSGRQRCGSGMFIPDPDFYPSRIPDLKTATKERIGKYIFSYLFFVAPNFTKIENYIIFEMLKKISWANFQRTIEFFTPKSVTKLSKIWVWDPGSGKNLFRILDPGV
jgi:hypothetical protein